jgi:hypothetical protein
MMLKKGIAQTAIVCVAMMLAGAASAAQPVAAKPKPSPAAVTAR